MSNDAKKEEKLTPVSLATMVGQGSFFEAQGKEYLIKPLKLKFVSEFMGDRLATNAPVFDFVDEDSVKKLEKWIPRVVYKGEHSLTLQDIMNDEWDTDDLKRMWQTVLQISG